MTTQKVFARVQPFLFLLTSLVFSACFTECDELQNDVRGRYGAPEEVNTYSSDGYNTVDWWYWSKGIEFTFTKADKEDCKQSQYTFTPIHNHTAVSKIDVVKTLVSVQTATGNCPTCP